MKYIKLFGSSSECEESKASMGGPCLFIYDKNYKKVDKKSKSVKAVDVKGIGKKDGGIVHNNVVKVESVKERVIIETPNDGKIVARFNISRIDIPVRLLSSVKAFGAVEIDGINQDVISECYTFDTVGLHIVKYTPINPTEVGNEAFVGVVDMVSVELPKEITKISYKSFRNCVGLTGFTIHSGITSIGGSAFYGCTGLVKMEIPESVASIGAEAFNGCTKLSSINIPSGIKSISGFLFYNCPKLSTIVIPSSVLSIGQGVFRGCKGMRSIVCNSKVAPSVTKSTFQSIRKSGVLYVPKGSSGYDVWMDDGDNYLGKYGWKKLEK